MGKKILIMKTSAIGDVIQSLSVIEYLKQIYPGCTIDWVVEKKCASLLHAHPNLCRVLEIDTQKWRKRPLFYRKEVAAFIKMLREISYDLLFDLQGNSKSGFFTSFADAEIKVGYDWNSTSEKPNWFVLTTSVPVAQKGPMVERYRQLIYNYTGIAFEKRGDLKLNLTQNEEARLSQLLTLGSVKPRIMICFGSNWSNKQLTFGQLEAFIASIVQMLSPSLFFIYGNEKEKVQAEKLAEKFSGFAVGEMSLPLWQQLMSHMDALITMDSAALHLCATTATPSFSLFGPSSAAVYKPAGEKHVAFQGSCPYGMRFDKRCPKLRSCATGACLKEASPERLVELFQHFWRTNFSEQLLGV